MAAFPLSHKLSFFFFCVTHFLEKSRKDVRVVMHDKIIENRTTELHAQKHKNVLSSMFFFLLLPIFYPLCAFSSHSTFNFEPYISGLRKFLVCFCRRHGIYFIMLWLGDTFQPFTLNKIHCWAAFSFYNNLS